MAPVRRAGSLAIYSSIGGVLSVSIPTSAQAGDIGIIVCSTASTSFSSASAPGWTLVQQRGTTKTNLLIFWKVLAASDAGATVSVSGTGWSSKSNVAAVEVWSAAKTPVATFGSGATLPSATAVADSIPLYTWLAPDASAPPPSSVTPPAGWGGSYLRSGSTTADLGLGLWFGNPTTGSSAPGGTLGGANYTAINATIILAPSQVQNVVLAGATSAQDIYLTPILAGASAAQDVNLVWTP